MKRGSSGFWQECAAKTFSNGDWYCALCGKSGDKDEAIEDHCDKKARTAREKDGGTPNDG